jgi:hypothetical protein
MRIERSSKLNTSSYPKLILVKALFLFTVSCSWQPSLFETSLGGAALGAGTGALVGNFISGGDIAASAGLGAAIGLPVGLAFGYYYQIYLEEQERSETAVRIRSQQSQILNTNSRLIQFKDDLDRDHPRDIDESRGEYHYNGQTFANPLR